MDTVDEAIQTLTSRRATLRRSDLVGVLDSLGFVVKAGTKPHHFIVKHPGLSQFPGSHFAATHGRDGLVKPCYTRSMRILIEERSEELRAFLERRQ